MNRVFAVHTVGRCGSRTIAHSLFGQGYAAVHTHNFAEPVNPYELTTKYILESYLSYNTELWVISLVRDPVARNLSVYYHTTQNPTESGFHTYSWNAPTRWVRKELVGYWGAPIFDAENEFDQVKGWSVYPTMKPRAKLVVIQLEKLEDAWPGVWYTMTNKSKAPKLTRIGESHAPNYSKFNIKSEYLDLVYDDVFAKTFYSEYDLKVFRRSHGA